MTPSHVYRNVLTMAYIGKNVNVNHSLLPSTITRILFCCRHNVSPSTAPSYVEDSNPGSLAPESGILPRGHGSSTIDDCSDVGYYLDL